jgi:hypothetical protein
MMAPPCAMVIFGAAGDLTKRLVAPGWLIYLRGSRALIAERLAGRQDHFMPDSLLQSQIDTLAAPGPVEDPLIIDIGSPAGQLADESSGCSAPPWRSFNDPSAAPFDTAKQLRTL